MSMEPFTVLKGAAGYLPRANIDTDVIIRVERFSVPRDKMGRWAMEPLRYLADGSENPTFVFNQPLFRGAPFLLAGDNFGCGSSREAAVWALKGMGIRCLAAPSFGDIFYSNCFQNGLLPVRLPAQNIEAIASACADGAALEADLVEQVLRAPDGKSYPFAIDSMRRDGLLQGLDEIGLTLKDDVTILEWQRADRLRRPWAWKSSADIPAR